MKILLLIATLALSSQLPVRAVHAAVPHAADRDIDRTERGERPFKEARLRWPKLPKIHKCRPIPKGIECEIKSSLGDPWAAHIAQAKPIPPEFRPKPSPPPRRDEFRPPPPLPPAPTPKPFPCPTCRGGMPIPGVK